MKNTIKTILESQDAVFQIKGVNDYKNKPMIFKMNHMCGDLELHSVHGVDSTQTMNVEKFGPTCMWLYSYDMLGNKTRSKVKYSDVIIK